MNSTLFGSILNDSKSRYKDTLVTCLSNIENRYDININLHDVAGVGNMNSILETLFFNHQYHNNPFCNYVKKITVPSKSV